MDTETETETPQHLLEHARDRLHTRAPPETQPCLHTAQMGESASANGGNCEEKWGKVRGKVGESAWAEASCASLSSASLLLKYSSLLDLVPENLGVSTAESWVGTAESWRQYWSISGSE
eukprot:1077492-Rhodomonas_salina.1